MPIDYKKYPKDWKEIRLKILDRAKNKCEFCLVENYSRGARDLNGRWYDEKIISQLNSGYGLNLFGDFLKIIKIVLTISHLDHNINNNCDNNLKALCQKCHLNHDKELHKINRFKNKKKNQLELNI